MLIHMMYQGPDEAKNFGLSESETLLVKLACSTSPWA